jgi:predicted flavoprotein YhiN
VKKKKLVIIGGGAAGFMAAITAAETQQNIDIIILEQGNEVLGKVRISGGGRCNVTHACYDVKELVKFYPRGNKELQSHRSINLIANIPLIFLKVKMLL